MSEMLPQPVSDAAVGMPADTSVPQPPQKPTYTVLGAANHRNRMRRFYIKRDDRRRHVYLLGKTGMGKSDLLKNMAISDIQGGEGLCYIDPHGDAAEDLLRYVPPHRVNDVIYFDPADIDYPIAFNVMESVNPKYTSLVGSGLIAIFKKMWEDSWGPRLEYILRNTVLALLEYPSATLLGVPRMYVDKRYRRKVVAQVTNPMVKSFWVDEYEAYAGQFMTEAVAPIQNKVGQFLSSSIIRNVVGQTKSTIDFRDIMDKKKILIVNLAKGKVGEDISAMFGAMIVTKLQLAAMSRVDIKNEDERQDFYLYVDEFQNFATSSFATILSEARKYRLNLTIAHQYITQLEETIRDAVFGNVGTMAIFRIGAEDADFLEREFEPHFMATDLVNLPKFQIYIKLMIDGVASQPFSASTLPITYPRYDLTDTIIRVSRERYTNPRQDVEEKIMRWTGIEINPLLSGEGDGALGAGDDMDDDAPPPRRPERYEDRRGQSDDRRPPRDRDDRDRPRSFDRPSSSGPRPDRSDRGGRFDRNDRGPRSSAPRRSDAPREPRAQAPRPVAATPVAAPVQPVAPIVPAKPVSTPSATPPVMPVQPTPPAQPATPVQPPSTPVVSAPTPVDDPRRPRQFHHEESTSILAAPKVQERVIIKLPSEAEKEKEKREKAREKAIKEGRDPDAPDTRPRFKTVCSDCGIPIELPFTPDPRRPVFCKDCLAEYRSREARKEQYKQEDSKLGVMPTTASRKPTASAAPQRAQTSAPRRESPPRTQALASKPVPKPAVKTEAKTEAAKYGVPLSLEQAVKMPPQSFHAPQKKQPAEQPTSPTAQSSQSGEGAGVLRPGESVQF